MHIYVAVILLMVCKSQCYERDEGSSEENSEGSSEDSSEESVDSLTVLENIIINNSTNLRLTRTIYEDNTEIVRSKVNRRRQQQTVYIDNVMGLRTIIPAHMPDHCLVYKSPQSQKEAKFGKQNTLEMNGQNLTTRSVERCLYSNIPMSVGTGPCKNKKTSLIQLMSCNPRSAKDIHLEEEKKKKRKKRTLCVPIWESYRFETTCMTTVLYPIVVQHDCFEMAEYFSRTFCF